MAMIHGRKLRLIFGLLIAAIAVALWPQAISASVFKRDSTTQISKIEVIDDDYYLYANRLLMDGIVNGDLCAFCYKSDIKGEVAQTANLFSQSARFEGKVGGSLRVFAQDGTIDGYVARSAVLLGQEMEVGKNCVIERDLWGYAQRLMMDGTVKGNAKLNARKIEITGVIVGNAELTGDNITISPPAVITGNLTYISKNKADIQLDKGVTITGTTTWNLPEKAAADEDSGRTMLTEFILRVSSLLAAFIFGLVVARVFRPYAEESFNQLYTRFSTSVAAGLLGILVLVLCVIVLVVSVAFMLVGYIIIHSGLAPLGSIIMIFSILMVPVTSFASVTGAIILYTGKILFGFLIGYLIMSRVRPGSEMFSKSGLFLGLVILSLLFAIPYFGWIAYLAASIIGTGAILLGMKYCRKGVWGAPTAPLPPAGGPVDPQGQA